MIAADLLPPTDRLPRHAAARLVAAAMAEYEALSAFDGEALSLSEEPAAAERGRRLRAIWSRWADEAEALYDRVKDDPSLGEDDWLRLDHRIRVARRIKLKDPAAVRRKLAEDEANGAFISRGEARRALGLPDRP